jgi:hypothetical protein
MDYAEYSTLSAVACVRLHYTASDSLLPSLECRLEAEGFRGFSHIYVVISGGSASAFVAAIDLSVEDGLSALRGKLDIRVPVAAEWALGSGVPLDYVLANNAVSILISEKFAAALRASGCTGWSTFPVNLTGRDGEPLHGYAGLRVTGRCGPIQLERSREGMKDYPGGRFPVYIGYYFEEGTWDGSDVFMPDAYDGTVLITEGRQEPQKRESQRCRAKESRFD